MSSSFETLPDEILMIIIRYSGNVYSIFHTFCGLNQRLNRILVDRRLHLLTDFLCIDNHTADVAEYYNSPLFLMLLQKLCSLRSHDIDIELRPCFQRLVSFYIQEKYRQLEHEFLSSRERFQSIRTNLHPDEIHLQDSIVKKTFNEFGSPSISLKIVQQLKNLVLQTGARLECTDSELGEFNLANAISQYSLAYSSTLRDSHRSHDNAIVQMFKALIISNPNLLKNKAYVGNGGSPTYFFLIYGIYRLRDFYSSSSAISINIRRYQSIIELLLFVIQCLRNFFNENSHLIDCLLNSLQRMNSIENPIDKQIIIETSQIEICNILFEEVSRKELVLDEQWDYALQRGLQNLILTNRVDVILSLSHQEKFLQHFFRRSDHGRKLLNAMTRNQTGRLLFQRLLNEQHLKSWFANIKLLFTLLDKKECKLIKKLLRFIPTLVQQIDDDGNDPLLYICLKVTGCRHNLVAFLIKMECDIHRKNNHGEHFFQVLQLRKNRKLLEKLIEHEIIVKDDETGLFQVTSDKQEEN